MFERTTAINKLLRVKARKKVIQGGTSAGKTYGIIPILIDFSTKNPRSITTVVAESIPAVRNGAVRIFQDVMIDTNRWIENHWIGNPMEYKFSNGAIIQFTSFDTVGKAKASGKRDMLFLNEANHINYLIADALMIRSKQTWIDYNPDSEFWAHTEVLQEPNSEFLLLKYTDNEAIPPETLEDILIKLNKAYYNPFGDRNDPNNIKNAYWNNWCKVYVDGEIGNLEGLIFPDFNLVDEMPPTLREVYGLDFGFTNDPTAIVDVRFNDGQLWFDEVIYRTQMTNQDIIQFYKNIDNKKIIADSSEPKSIEEIRRSGINIEGAIKGSDSIRRGIDLMQSYPINVTKRSINLIKELRGYKWAVDRSGKQLNTPIEINNHAIDAVRYGVTKLVGKPEVKPIAVAW